MSFSIWYEVSTIHVIHTIHKDRIQRTDKTIREKKLLIENLTESQMTKLIFTIDPMKHSEYYIEKDEKFVRADRWVNQQLGVYIES